MRIGEDFGGEICLFLENGFINEMTSVRVETKKILLLITVNLQQYQPMLMNGKLMNEEAL